MHYTAFTVISYLKLMRKKPYSKICGVVVYTLICFHPFTIRIASTWLPLSQSLIISFVLNSFTFFGIPIFSQFYFKKLKISSSLGLPRNNWEIYLLPQNFEQWFIDRGFYSYHHRWGVEGKRVKNTFAYLIFTQMYMLYPLYHCIICAIDICKEPFCLKTFNT